jgi:hypothetical protein
MSGGMSDRPVETHQAVGVSVSYAEDKIDQGVTPLGGAL